MEGKIVDNTIFSVYRLSNKKGYVRQVRNAVQKGETVHSGILDLA